MDGAQPIEVEINGLIKQSAFKQCYKRLTELRNRYPKSSYYEVLELYVKYKHLPHQFDIEGSILTPYVRGGGDKLSNDLRMLDLLYRMLIEMNRYEDAIRTIEMAHKKFGGWELAYYYFDKSLQVFDYRRLIDASAALCSYGKDETKKRDYRMFNFWNAIATLVYFKYQSSRVTSMEREILPRVCMERLETLRPFENEQESIIYCMVSDELMYPERKIPSEIILSGLEGGSIDLYMKRYMLRHVSDAEVLFDKCGELLAKIDDYALIQKLITTGHELGKSKEELQELIVGTVGDSRNNRLSWFEMDLVYCQGSMISGDSLRYYLDKFHNKPCCEIDISTYREHIDMGLLCEIMDSLPRDVIHDCNMFKLGLCRDDSVTLYGLYRDTLKGKAKTDYSLVANFILDIVGGSQDTVRGKLLSITILENYQQRDRYNFHTMVPLIRLYMDLGFVTLAHTVYKMLKVKNVQVDSMGGVMFSRVGSLFPIKSHEMIGVDMLNHMNTYDVGKVEQFIKIGLERGVYSKIDGLVEFRERLVRSMNRIGLLCEQIEISLFYNNDKKQRNVMFTRLHSEVGVLKFVSGGGGGDGGMFSDNRDKRYVDARGYGCMNEVGLVYKILRLFMIESVMSGGGIQRDEDINMLERYIAGGEGDESCSGIEEWSFSVISRVYSGDMDGMEEMLVKGENDDDGGWLMVHNYLVRLSTLKVLQSSKKCGAYHGIIQEELNALRESCDGLFMKYRDVVSRALDEVKGEDILKVLGYTAMKDEMFTESLLALHKYIRNL